MRLHPAALAIGLLLTGCAHTPSPEPSINPPVREVPVPVPCKPDIGPEPAYPDTDAALAATTDIFEGVKLFKAGRAMRVVRLSELTDALKACEAAQ